MLFEAYPLLVDKRTFSMKDVCEETCLLEPASPYSLKLELIDAILKIDHVAIADTPRVVSMDLAAGRKRIQKAQRDAKLGKIKEEITKRKLKWRAGETSISQMTWEEKHHRSRRASAEKVARNRPHGKTIPRRF